MLDLRTQGPAMLSPDVDAPRVQAASFGPEIQWRVDAADRQAWDVFAAQFDDVNHDQYALYTEHQWPGRTCRIQIFENGAPLGGAIVVLLIPPLFQSGLAYVKFGPLWRPAGTSADPSRYETVVRVLIEEFVNRGGHQLVIVPRPTPEILAREETVLRRLGFVVKRATPDPNRYLVDCTLSKDDQLKSLAQKWRYNLRKSWKNEITVRSGASEDYVRVFTELHSQMKGRKQFGDHEPVDLVPELIRKMPPALGCTVYLASHKDTPVAGAVVTRQGDSAFYMFGASADSALPLKAGYALQWAIIDDLREQPVRWYDLGGEAGDQGLKQFKKGLVGREGHVLCMPGEFELKGSMAGSIAAELIFAARAVSRIVKERRR